MTIGDIFSLLIVALVLIFSIRQLVKNKEEGCASGCSRCSKNSSCLENENLSL